METKVLASPRIFTNIPVLLGLCCFVSVMSLRACDTLLPMLAEDFSVTVGQAARVIFVFAISYGVFQLLFGPLGDRYGKLRIIAICALSSVIGNLMAVLSPTLDWLVVARMVSGASAAGIFPLAMAWIGDNVAYQARQAALAQLLTAGVLGMLAGQWLTGLIAEWVGWRPAFLLIALGFLIAGGMLTAILWRQGSPAPAVGKRVYRLRDIVAAPACRWILSVVMIEGALAFGALAFMPSLLQRHHEVSMAMAGGIAALYAVGGGLYTRVAGRLLSRIGEAGLARLGGVLMLLGLTSFAWTPWLGWAPVASFVAGFGFYCLHNTLQTHATQMAPAARGAAVSLFAAFLFIGQSLGVSGAAWIADQGADRLIFLCAGLGLVVLGFMVARKGPPEPSPSLSLGEAGQT